MGRYTNFIKGKEIKKFHDNYTVIDIETTGLDAFNSDIIEISALKYRHNRKIDEYVTLINIEKEIPKHITKLTGITNNMLTGAPKPKDALKGFLEFINNDILMGYNVTFDIAFLTVACENYLNTPVKNNYVDVMNLTSRYIPSLGITKQINVAEYFGIGTKGSHRASTDCEICNGCYQKIREKAIEEYYTPPDQIILTCKAGMTEKKPFAGKVFFFLGILDRWYIKNIQETVLKLGGTIQDKADENVNIIIVGTADAEILGSEEFQYFLNLKNSGGQVSIMKDEVFIKALFSRNFVEKFKDGEEITSLFD